MQSVDPSIGFDEALRRLRDDYDDDYEGWLTGMNDVMDVARDLDIDDIDFVGKPEVQHAIWRYQHHDPDTVRGQIEHALQKYSLGLTVDEAVDRLRAVAEEM